MEFSALHISFAAFVLIALGAGLGLALSKRFIYAAFLLFALLFGVAAIFIFAGAELLAVAQLIVYVGGILILLVFGIMLTRKRISGFAETALHQSIPSALVGIGTAAVLLFVFLQVDWESLEWMQKSVTVESGLNNPQMIGKQLLSSYLLPFELMGVLLLLALIGAAYIAKEKA